MNSIHGQISKQFMFLMTLCRRSQKLATSDEVLDFLLQAFCRPTLIRGQQRVQAPVLREELRYVCTATQGQWPALRGQQRTEAPVLREEVRYVCTSTQGQWPDSTGRSELSPIRQSRLFEIPRKAGIGTMSKCLVKKASNGSIGK
ncbi:hypothetical protein L7F22_022505 [Adiantum nelumboides]|nr:hypothetical protein [Adiantum nelumboides]